MLGWPYPHGRDAVRRRLRRDPRTGDRTVVREDTWRWCVRFDADTSDQLDTDVLHGPPHADVLPGDEIQFDGVVWQVDGVGRPTYSHLTDGGQRYTLIRLTNAREGGAA